MSRFALLLVDDEPLARQRLKNLLSAHPEVEVVGEAGNLAEARRVLASVAVDLVLLDIDLFGEDGFDLIPDLPPQTRVTFVTAHNQYAIKAFECQAIDYLLKPVEPQRLGRSLERLRQQERGEELRERELLADRIPLRDRGRIFLVPKGEIIAIFAEREYTRVLSENFPPLLLRKTMQRWEEELASPSFLRVHRHALVNLGHVLRLEESDGHASLHLRNLAAPITVSTRQLAELKSALRQR